MRTSKTDGMVRFTGRGNVLLTMFTIMVMCLALSACRSVPVEEPVVHYSVSGAGDTTLVFIHGWLCDSSYWQDQVSHFRDRYQIITIDLMGHGESPNQKRTTIEGLASDLIPVIQQNANDNVVLIGHSMGGPVVLETARLLEDFNVSVVGVDTLRAPNRKSDPDRLKAYIEAVTANFHGVTAKMVRTNFFLPDANPQLVDRIAHDMAEGPQEVGIDLLYALAEFDSPAALKAISEKPLLLINSDYQPTDLNSLQDYHPLVRVRTMKGIGHFVQMENPTIFNQILQSELDELAKKP